MVVQHYALMCVYVCITKKQAIYSKFTLKGVANIKYYAAKDFYVFRYVCQARNAVKQ